MANKSAGWRRDGEGKAHLLIKQGCVIKPRCKFLSEVNGVNVLPPITGYEDGYCYNCHYFAIFDTMPKVASQVLTRLLNREIEAKIAIDRKAMKANSEAHDRDVQSRFDEACLKEKKLREMEEKLHDSEKYAEFVQLGKALDKVAKGLGSSFAHGYMEEMMRGGPFGRW